MKNGLYNKAIYWPEELQRSLKFILEQRYIIVPTYHMACKIKQLDLPKHCYTAVLYGETIEVLIENSTIVKIVTRIPNRFNNKEDICAAIGLKNGEAQVRTIWINNRLDNHSTIHTDNYIKGA